MKNVFSAASTHKIVEANVNFYATPFVHPKRVLKEHDFIYMLEGEWKIGQNGKSYQLTKDNLLILSAGAEHYGEAPCKSGTKTMFFHVSDENDYFGDNSSGIETFIDASKNKRIKKLFSNVVTTFLAGEKEKANLYFELLILELAHSSGDAGIEIGDKIKNIIHSAPEKFFSNNELAEMLNISVKTAENKFKEKFSITIHQYILNHKIKEAISYFETFPEISIKEVAFNLGFYDEYHFSKQFKKIMGISPLYYKNKN